MPKTSTTCLDKFRTSLKTAQENHALATKFLNVILYWNKKEKFDFKDLQNNTVKIFGDSEVFFKKDHLSYGLSFSSKNVRSFLDNYYENVNRPHPKYYQLNKVVLFLEKIENICETDYDRFFFIASEFDNVIKK